MADMVTVQELENAKIDALTIGESVNENKIVTPRYGAPFKSMPMIAEEMQSVIGAIIGGGVPANIVADNSGLSQQQVNNNNESALSDRYTKSETNSALLLKANQADVDSSLALKADKSDTFTKSEVSSLVSPKADTAYVDAVVGAISTDASKQYATLALANADIANIALNQNVFISEEVNGGYWYKATAGATSLTKSPYDPLTKANARMDANAIFKPVDLTGSETITNLPNGTYHITSSTIANLLASQLPPATSPVVGTLVIINRNSVIREVIFKRYTANSFGEYQVFKKTSTGAGTLAWLDWQKEVSRYEFDLFKSNTPSLSLFKATGFESTDATRYQATVTIEDGLSVLSIAATPDNASVFYEYSIDNKLFVVGKSINFSADAMSDVIGAGAAGTDISIVAYDAAGATLQTVTARNTVVNTWQTVTATMVIPANTVKFALRFIRRIDCTYAKYRKPTLSSNTWLASTIVQAPMIGVGHLNTYISATGSDTIGDGSVNSPFATPTKALSVMSGVGDIIVKGGKYYNLQFNAQKIKDLKILALNDGLIRPEFYYSSKLTSITNVSGKVYKASSTLSGQPNYIWHDDVPDPFKIITFDEIVALQRGRSSRCNSTQIVKTTATNRTDAIAEIQSSSDPRCFYDSTTNEILFAIGSGGDATNANIYVPVTGGYQTLFMNRSASIATPSAQTIEICGIDLKYGSLNTRGASVKTILRDCGVLGAAANCYDLANFVELYGCEAAGAGSTFIPNGDGFNIHNDCVIEHRNCYTHDNYDDGISSHENCLETGFGMTSEYNGGGGLTPAYGAQFEYDNCISRKNNGVTSRFNTGKTGGFECHAANTGGGDDTSTQTSGTARNCTSIGDKNGFVDLWYVNGTNSRMTAYNCTSIDPVEYGFACSEIQDCSHSGTGTAKAPDISGRSVTVRNTTTVS